jgi:hypothetical protein
VKKWSYFPNSPPNKAFSSLLLFKLLFEKQSYELVELEIKPIIKIINKIIKKLKLIIEKY